MRIISASEKMITFSRNLMTTSARSFDVKLSVDPEERNKSDFYVLSTLRSFNVQRTGTVTSEALNINLPTEEKLNFKCVKKVNTKSKQAKCSLQQYVTVNKL